MDNRIIELAIEALEKQKTAIETEIAELKSAVSKQHGRFAATAKAGSSPPQSERMKAHWAKKKAKATKAAPPEKGRAVARKPGPQSAAARKAISERMKAYWAKRKAAEAKRSKRARA